MNNGPTIIIVNDCDHMTNKRAKNVFSFFNDYDIPFTNAIFNELETYDEFPNKFRSLAKHCHPIETCSITDVNSSEYIDLLKKQIRLGNEIAYHGNSQISNSREQFSKGIKNINDSLKIKMKTYIEHGGNPKRHPIEHCKKETLAMLGNKKESEYYVYDLILQNFEQAWCYFDLVDLENHKNFNKNFIFNKTVDDPKDIIFIKRTRAVDIKKAIRLLNKEDDVCILYTHFGYDGYPSGTLMERWDSYHSIEKNCIFLKKLQKKGFSITTVEKYLKKECLK